MINIHLFNINKELLTTTFELEHYDNIFDYHIFSVRPVNIGIFGLFDLQGNPLTNSKQYFKNKIYGLDLQTNKVTSVGFDFQNNTIKTIQNTTTATIHFNVESLPNNEIIYGIRVQDVEFPDIVKDYIITFKSTKSSKKEIYDDFLDNAYLPHYDELEFAIINEDKYALIRRLLLDYKCIMRNKGTDVSIEKFLNFIGFDPDTIRIYPEYITPNDERTTNPNKLVDKKTGYYQVLFDNWTAIDENSDNTHLTKTNLPYRPINQQNIDEFFERLYYGIMLANKYFTIPEQDISFFGFNVSANNEMMLSIAGNNTVVFDDDIHNFRHDIDINMYVVERETEKSYIIKNKKQQDVELYKSEIKAITDGVYLSDSNLVPIIKEIYDDEDITKYPPFTFIKTFGNVLHLDITVKRDLYLEYVIYDEKNISSKYESKYLFLQANTTHNLKLITKLSSTYKVNFYFYDIHNNREKYFYKYTLTNKIKRVDFEIFNSIKIHENHNKYYINQDIDSSTVYDKNSISNREFSGIVKYESITDFLDNYFSSTDIVRNVVINEQWETQEISKNEIINNITTTIPLEYIDNLLEIGSIPFKPTYKLLIKDNLSEEITLLEPLQLMNSWKDKYYPNLLYLTITDVYTDKNSQPEKYIFITTTKSGLNLKPLFKIYYIDENYVNELLNSSFDDSFDDSFPKISNIDFTDERVKLIYDLEDYISTIIPVNYDIPITFPDNEFNIAKDNGVIKSIFPRLNRITDIIPNNDKVYNGLNFYLDIGDIIVARPNQDYIVNAQNLRWQIINSFDKKVLYETTDFALKYRIDKKCIFDIILTFEIYGIQYKIEKKSIQSSIKIV